MKIIPPLRKGVGYHLKFLAVEANVLADTITQTLYTFANFGS